MLYFIHNNIHVAAIAKSGHSALARAIHLSKKPHFCVRGSSKENEQRAWDGAGWSGLIPRVKEASNPIILVRDPVDRFSSACGQIGVTDINAALSQLEDGVGISDNFHFKKTSDYLAKGSNQLFKFPDHLPNISEKLKIGEITKCNASSNNGNIKPQLTDLQVKRVKAIYAKDLDLFESIKNAGDLHHVD